MNKSPVSIQTANVRRAAIAALGVVLTHKTHLTILLGSNHAVIDRNPAVGLAICAHVANAGEGDMCSRYQMTVFGCFGVCALSLHSCSLTLAVILDCDRGVNNKKLPP